MEISIPSFAITRFDTCMHFFIQPKHSLPYTGLHGLTRRMISSPHISNKSLIRLDLGHSGNWFKWRNKSFTSKVHIIISADIVLYFSLIKPESNHLVRSWLWIHMSKKIYEKLWIKGLYCTWVSIVDWPIVRTVNGAVCRLKARRFVPWW